MWGDILNLFPFFLGVFTSIFVIVNPIGTVPVFISLTEGMPVSVREKISKKSCFYAGGILILFAIGGNAILEMFNVTLSGLKIAGGFLLMIISIDMLFGNPPRTKYSREEEGEAQTREDLAIFPLALPLYTGPGSITTVIVLMTSAEGWLAKSLILVSIVLTYVIVRLTQKYSNQIYRILGMSGTRVLTRIMAILLATIAVEFIWSGIQDKIALLLSSM
jgi:multiple antibiotic resistance protein